MKLLTILLLIFAAIFTACTFDQITPVVNENCVNFNATYDGDVKLIIDNTCAFVGCHLGGAAPGDYSAYVGMNGFLNDQGFKERVIDLRDDPDEGMPPDWPSNLGPHDLSPEEFEIMSCWINAGYPEN